MIGLEEIRALATEWGVAESIVEKNYVIGWLLWGIGQDPDLSHKWVFKGGTCIKKCYLETYRFSEDLDFTVLPEGPSKPEELISILNRVLEYVHGETGINFSICSVCGKKFTRSQYDAILKPHKNRTTGYDCYGGVGIYEGTQYG